LRGGLIKFLFLLLISTSLLAVNDESLSFESYLNSLKHSNLSLKVKRNELKKKELDLKHGYYSFLPKIDFNYGATISSTNDNAFSSFLPSSSPKNPSWNKSLTINLPIFLGGKRFDYIKIASSNKKLSSYDLEASILELKSRAVTLFIKAYNSQNQLPILEKSLELAKQNYENALVLKSVDRIVEVDLLTFKLSYEERNNAILNLKMELNNAFIELSSLVNKDIEIKKLIIEQEIPDNIKKMSKDDLIKFYIKKMKNYSPVVKKIREYHQISKYNLDLSFKNYYPNISMRYNYSPYTDNFWEFPLTKGHSLSLVLSFNIFNSFLDSLEYKKNKFNVLNTDIELKKLINAQEDAIKKAVNILKNSLIQIESVKSAIKISKEKLEQIKIGYSLGKYNYLDLLKAENDWFSRQNNLLNLKMQIYNSYYQLQIISASIKSKTNNIKK